jgi:hypothetical protein
LRHHIITINSLLHDHNIQEAQNYLEKLDKKLKKTMIEKYCGNYVINVILSSYIKKAKDEKITVCCQVDIPENITIDSIEIGLIFSNAIENAIIACKQLEDYTDRKIDITCKNHYNQLYIQICNTYVGDILFEEELPISKETNHGFGTKSIAAIAGAFNGIYSFSAKDGIFKTTVILNNETVTGFGGL